MPSTPMSQKALAMNAVDSFMIVTEQLPAEKKEEAKCLVSSRLFVRVAQVEVELAQAGYRRKNFSDARSVDRHASRCWAVVVRLRQVIHLHNLLFVVADLALHDEWLQTLVEVQHACYCVGDGEDDQDDGEHGEDGHGLSSGLVVLFVAGLVHADELEAEVGEAAEVENHDYHHAGHRFAACPEGGHEEDEDCDWDGGGGKGEFDVRYVGDDNKELDGEADEEEEIELQECDVNLCNVLVGEHGNIASQLP